MAADYYDPNQAAPPPPGEAKPEATDTEEGDGGASCLVPKSVLGEDLKPGATVTVKVLHVYGDEYEVGPAGSEETAPGEDAGLDEAMTRMSRPNMGGE
jgi:hypothetical protein